MEEEICFDTTSELITTHFFIYKNNTFPFNINSFKCVSRYFDSIQSQPEENTNIELLNESEDDITLDESLIKNFINFFHMNKITLNKQNVFPLLKLAKKFIVPSLIKATEKFITSHRKELVIEFLLMNEDQQDFNTEEYEEIISNNVTDFIEDKKLLSLPLPVLHRIVTKYQLKNNTLEEPPEFIEFLFKCLDHFGQKASVLFDHFDFGKSNGSVTRKLLNEYSEKFDFHFINAIQLKTVYKLESEIIEREKVLKLEQEQMKAENEKSKQNQVEMLLQQLATMKHENESLIKQQEERNKENDKQIQDQRVEFERKLNEMNEKIRILSEKVDSQNGLIEKLKNKNSKKIEYKNDKLNGIIKYLGGGDANKVINDKIIDIKSSSEYQDTYWNMKYVFDFNDSKKGFCSCNASNSWFCYDFKGRKVNLSHYSLQSHGWGERNTYHLISWCIEGSNDFDLWFELDSRNKEESVAESNKTEIFEITKNCTGYYQYIRIRQTGLDTSNNYWLAFSAIEFFGNIFEL